MWRHARIHARTQARTHARMHTRTHTRTFSFSYTSTMPYIRLDSHTPRSDDALSRTPAEFPI